tara:strand:+ start:56 stop:535 length:480 start_codon:yes stop_codon:yes gene_type:complete
MNWEDILKVDEWDLSYRWRRGIKTPPRPNLPDEEIIRTLEYVLQQYNELTNQEYNTLNEEARWAREYAGIRSGQFVPVMWQAREKDNQHIKMLLNDIKDLEDGPLGDNSFTILSEMDWEKYKKLSAKDMGLTWRLEQFTDREGAAMMQGYDTSKWGDEQ